MSFIYRLHLVFESAKNSDGIFSFTLRRKVAQRRCDFAFNLGGFA